MRRVGTVALWVSIGLVAGCASVRWATLDEWARFSQRPVSAATNPVTLGVGAYGSTGLGRITEGGTEGNDRRWWVLDELSASDSEIVSLWWDHTAWAEGGGQLGQVHRAQTLPDGTLTGYMVWHDYIYAQDEIIHGAVWFSSPTAGFWYEWLGSVLVEDLLSLTTVADGSRGAGVVTLTLPAGHEIQGGDTIMVDVADDGYDGVFTVTEVGATWVRYAQAGADDPAAGPGTAYDLDRVMPYWVRSRLEGDTLSIKVWAEGEAEPSWSDTGRVRTWVDTAGVGPDGAGVSGIYAGHVEGGDWVEYGPVDVLSLDYGAGESAGPAAPPAVLEPTPPTPLDQAAAATLTGDTELEPVAEGSGP